MLRLTGNLPADVMSPLWQDIAIDGQSAATGPLHPIAARMIGNALAFDVFRLRTGCLPAESESAVVVVDTETLTSTREALVVHPECPSCRPLAIAQAAGSAPSTASAPSPSDRELSERYWRLVDPHVGLFAAYTDESLPQSPVKAARVRIGLGTAPREITAFDVRNLLAARNRAVQTAALRYADRLGRGQPTQVATSKQQSAHGSVARPDRLGTWSGIPVPEDQRLHWLTATSALSGDRWYVPAAAVYDLFDDGKLFDSPSAGAGGGVDLTAAVEAGVLSALGYRALRATAAGATVSDATADYPEDPEITMLLHAAEHLGHPIRVYALPADDCAVSVLATTTDSDESPPRWVVSTAWTARDAVCDAARDLVGVLQLASDGPVDLGGRIAPDFDPRTVRVGTGHRVGPRDGRALWRRHLAEAGLDALVVETTPPDLVCADTALQTVRVLLHQIATGEGGALT
jgi:bacteriocin biosynthesis cyclodehydratase domain-containing protein